MSNDRLRVSQPCGKEFVGRELTVWNAKAAYASLLDEFAEYPTGNGFDSHPSREGNERAATEFVPYLESGGTQGRAHRVIRRGFRAHAPPICSSLSRSIRPSTTSTTDPDVVRTAVVRRVAVHHVRRIRLNHHFDPIIVGTGMNILQGITSSQKITR